MAFGGIDPGKQGFAALISSSGEVLETHVQPLLSKAKGDQFNVPAMNAMIRRWKEAGVELVVVELQTPQGGARSSAQRGFMQAAPYFLWKALLVAHNVRAQYVKDVVWKKLVGVQKPKREPKKPEPAKPKEKGAALAAWKKEHAAWKKEDNRRLTRNKNQVKAESAKTAQSLFPGVDLRRTDKCEAPDDNKCEALLLAEVARRIHGGEATA
jgi:hypothetical protein